MSEEEPKRATGLWVGYETMAPAPGECAEMECITCGDKMNVERNVRGATSYAESRSGRTHLFDRFICPNAGLDWHVQCIKILQEMKQTSSSKVEALLKQEYEEIKKTRKATKQCGIF